MSELSFSKNDNFNIAVTTMPDKDWLITDTDSEPYYLKNINPIGYPMTIKIPFNPERDTNHFKALASWYLLTSASFTKEYFDRGIPTNEIVNIIKLDVIRYLNHIKTS